MFYIFFTYRTITALRKTITLIGYIFHDNLNYHLFVMVLSNCRVRYCIYCLESNEVF